MFNWLFKKKDLRVEEETRKAFSAVKKDMGVLGKWVKHLDTKDKHLFDAVSELKKELATIRKDMDHVKESLDVMNEGVQNKQLLVKTPVFGKQTAVEGVGISVQTAVQTGNNYDIFRSLSANERLLIFTLLNSEMKLSYEDLALLLGKERATIRGQVNAIKQKNEGLLEEVVEKNGKKRVFIPDEMKEKLSKYAKVRVKKKRLNELKEEEEVKNE